MKKTFSALTVLVMAALMSLPALAADQSKHIKLYQDVEVNGTQLRAGDYTVKFDNAAQNGKIEFMKGHKTVATANAQVKQMPAKAPADQVILNTANGKSALDQIQFGGSNTALVFGSGSMAAGE